MLIWVYESRRIRLRLTDTLSSRVIEYKAAMRINEGYR
jgi:hypothetical protein